MGALEVLPLGGRGAPALTLLGEARWYVLRISNSDAFTDFV